MNDGTMSLKAHLSELRVRLIRCFIIFIICIGIAYFFRKEMLDLLRIPVDRALQKYTTQVELQTSNINPLQPKNTWDCSCEKKEQVTSEPSEKIQLLCTCNGLSSSVISSEASQKKSPMVFISLPEVFFTHMKLAFFMGFFLVFPYLMIELWGFVAPALFSVEKKIFWIFSILTYLCFTGGAIFGYFVVFPYGFDFFLSLTQPGELMPSLSIAAYLSFSLKLLFAFGSIFEFPLCVFILSRIGIITPKWMLSNAKYAIVILALISAFLTPPDPFTMLLMSIPLILLYFISVLVSYIGVNRKNVALQEQEKKLNE